MRGEEVPENIRQFVRDRIDSVEQLEVLSLLITEPEKEWTCLSMSLELRSTEGSVEKRLRDLVNHRVLEPPEKDVFRYRPSSPQVDATVRDLVAYYRLRPYRVMDLLFSKPVNTIQTFADSFRFKKEDS